ncbi:MAG: zinc ribbon domain-containing protein [Phycisphaerales bacterium]|jgi:hypothetical protein
MIIWGTRGITSTVTSGNFFCPSCMQESTYQHRRVRRFFTLYFIPLIPLDTAGEFVQCGVCQGQFNMRVLSLKPGDMQPAPKADSGDAMRGAMAVAMVHGAAVASGGTMDSGACGNLASLLAGACNLQLSVADVGKHVKNAATNPDAWQGPIRSVLPQIDEKAKEAILRSGFGGLSVGADGVAGPEGDAFLKALANAMNMSPAHVRGILAEFNQPPQQA